MTKIFYTYPAIVHDDPDGLWAEFPDLGGCFTYADTLGDLLQSAAEALECHIADELERGNALPPPSHIKNIAVSAENQFATLVNVDLDATKDEACVEKLLKIPSWLNDRATMQGIDFSKTLQDALLAKVV